MTDQRTSFIDVAADSDFPIQNLPYGIFSEATNHQRRVGVALGEWVVDLAQLEAHGFLKISDHQQYFNQATLNKFIESGKANWSKIRAELQDLLSAQTATLRDNASLRDQVFFQQTDVILHLPVQISGYTDFYSSKEHATNVGCMFRDPKNALLPNWSELPVGYNGRASSVIVSGTDIVRPSGQVKFPDAERPSVLCPVRARGHRRAYPRQDCGCQAQGNVDGWSAIHRLRRREPPTGHQRSRGGSGTPHLRGNADHRLADPDRRQLDRRRHHYQGMDDAGRPDPQRHSHRQEVPAQAAAQPHLSRRAVAQGKLVPRRASADHRPGALGQGSRGAGQERPCPVGGNQDPVTY